MIDTIVYVLFAVYCILPAFLFLSALAIFITATIVLRIEDIKIQKGLKNDAKKDDP